MFRALPPVHSPLSPLAVLRSMGHDLEGPARLRHIVGRRFLADEVVLLDSGTQALQLALETATHALGDAAVALPCFGCYDMASAAVGAGRPVRFYDLDPATLSPDLDSLRRAVEAGARVVVAAPLYALPVDVAGIREVLRPAGAILVEDAAQGHGGSWHGRALGSHGDLSVLSFGRGKGWTGGGGGALLVRSTGKLPRGVGATLEPLMGTSADAARALRALGQWALARPSLYPLAMRLPGLHLGETRYLPPRPPRHLSAFSGALASATGEASDREAAVRRENATWLRMRLEERRTPSIGRVDAVGGEPGFLRFPVRVASARSLAATRKARSLGIHAGYPRLLPTLEALRPLLPGETSRFPGGEELRARLLTAPTHSWLSERDRAALVATLTNWRA